MFLTVILLGSLLVCESSDAAISAGASPAGASVEAPAAQRRAGAALAEAALERTRHRVVYDGSYRVLDYPGGDVPDDRGVCTDVVIRSYRVLGIDLQRRVHEDLRASFEDYPDRWGLLAPDRNIDHRRFPNLRAFLRRQGAELPASTDPRDYLPGDLVTWELPGGLPHIGIVVSGDDGPEIVHNIGAGPRREPVLFDFPITGHYRWLPFDMPPDVSGRGGTVPVTPATGRGS